ncbi:hypothetical protein BDU57DRAFT_439951 [Ampelomyces quisqualis]|uniref:Uncharacterized protein n=1 Tax=Ampelomyces quisqualis TaxID=50730 RepID=A0A6A5R450_AMPQU|nr:hypothetical protein BDU57DRAFT_439951 [Ampelomyces quisqualis]
MSRPSRGAAPQGKRVQLQPAISDESARAPTRTAADSGDSGSGSGSDSDSELSESSEEPSDESSGDSGSGSEDDSENAVVNLRAGQGQKPKMTFDKSALGPDIRDFLKDFLPQLKAANDELEAKRRAGTLKSREIEMTDADDQEQCIEMDLGLGVLEEKDANAQHSSASDSDEDMQDGDAEKDVLGKLMGSARRKEPVSIQEVQDAQQTC